LATNFPEELDNLSNPSSTDSMQGHADLHTNVNDALEALQTKVGIDGSTDATSLDYRVTALEVAPPSTEAKLIYETVSNNTGSEIAKGKAVYVSGAVGASGKLRVSLASNAAESTSTKTFGITRAAIANGSEGEVVSEGLLQGINTVGANDGDPVWLGTGGSLLFGLANKPSAPSHLVFLGIVIRGGQSNTGSMFVKVQNGFELEELHNIQLTNVQDGDVLKYDSSLGLWINSNEFATTSYVDDAISTIGNSVDSVTTLLGLEGNNDLVISGIENQTQVDQFAISDYRTVKYHLQISRGTDFYVSDFLLLADGTNINVVESNVISNTSNALANISFEENSGIISLYVTPTGSAVTARFVRTSLKA
jgi:hypothetical protein